MIKPLLFRSNHLYYIGLLMLAAGLPVSLFLTSLAQFVLAGAFFIEGNFIEKFRRFFRNKTAMIIAGIWLMHVIGLLYTSDLVEGFKDVRIKLPLLIFPVIIAGSEPLSRRHFNRIIFVFIISVFAGTMVSMAVLTGMIDHPVHDIRDIFIFHISHIRFALLCCMAIFSIFFFLKGYSSSLNVLKKAGLLLVSAWLITFLFIMESVTGIAVLILVSTTILLMNAYRKNRIGMRIIFLLLAILLPVSAFLVTRYYIDEMNFRHRVVINTDALTAQGNHYRFGPSFDQYENGYPVWAYNCEEELRASWNQRSDIPYDSLDQRGQKVKFTLMRFMTSKGLRKDAEGILKMDEKEIHSVEGGIANVNYQDITSMKARLLQILWEWDHFMKGGDPSGHSVTQRLEFWKAASGIVSANIIAGVGTGDMRASYARQYELMKSRLSPEWRLRAHNQFLAIAVAFGLAGLAYFLFALFYTLKGNKNSGYFYFTFWMIAMLSMLTEDTLETQTGATFFAFFCALFLFGMSPERQPADQPATKQPKMDDNDAKKFFSSSVPGH